MALTPDAVLAFVSGIPLIILGGVLLWLRPWRRQQVFFGLFSILWGGQVLTSNVGRMVCDAALHQPLLLLSHGFMATATVFLAHFAGLVQGSTRPWRLTAILGTFSIATLVTLVIDPALIVASVAADGCITTRYGPLAGPLVHIPFFATFVLAAFILDHSYRRARPGTARHRLRGVILALMLFASYQFVRNSLAFLHLGDAAQFASSAVDAGGTWNDLLLVTSFTTGALLLAGLAVYNYLRPPAPEDPDLQLLFAFIGPALVAVAEDLLADHGIMQLETLGFWRLVAVGILVYTLAQYQLFDLDVRLKRIAGPGTAAIIVLFGIPFVLSLAQGDLGRKAALITLVPEAIGVGAVLLFHHRIGERLFPGARDTADYQHHRRLELYKVALEDALVRHQDLEGPAVAALRTRFEINETEHRMLVWMVQGQSPGHSAAAATTLEPGNVILGRYRLERTIGGRGQRETFLATDVRSRQPVVVKAVELDAMDGAAAALLLREARLAASLSHPNVLTIFDVAEEGHHALLVMDYADMGNLDQLVTKRGKLQPAEAVRFLSELLAGLQVVHERGIVHGNLKPENILLDADGSVLISDFAAAIGEAHHAGDDAHATMARDLLHDPLYLSPEQLDPDAPVDARSDLYLAGVLFHIALTGRYPLRITGRSEAQIRYAIKAERPELRLDEAVRWAEPILQRALAKDPAERYPEARSMQDDLAARAGIRPRALTTPA